ncbi:MAG: hypothetical protein LCH38_12160 [Proteobacteria bacterium]|nr:hypothetical protein [Pseudomonadota bacterium]
MQTELFPPARLVLRDALVGADGRAPLAVIGCSRKKRAEPAPAQELYTSDRFKRFLGLARRLEAPFVILSGKHGIVQPNQTIDPYDVDVARLPQEERSSWAERAIDALASLAEGRTISLWAIDDYCHPLLDANRDRSDPLPIVAPLSELEAPDQQLWLTEAIHMASRLHDVNKLYNWIDRQRDEGKVFSFASLSTSPVPKRGVYLFLDPDEPNLRRRGPRVVRIGTHAVSAGSQASLRGRLRNHLGPSNAIGNHRGSIFRLHVGRAMLEAGAGHASLPSWGDGQDAKTDIKALEQAHELEVSNYLQRLELVLFDVDDPPSKDSLRARIEAQLIALFSDGLKVLDRPSSAWLGRHSPVISIRQSGLWNVRGVGARYDPKGVGSVTSLIGH